ncbi:MAG: ABC transporter permease [Phycisphaerae bacterium]
MKNYHPIKELWLTRMRTFYREPEAIFWTYVFPILLTIGLGIAFRNRPQETIVVDVEASPTAAAVKNTLDALDTFDAHINTASKCAERLRLGKTDIVVKPGDKYEYRYDPSRPESAMARAALDDALQRAGGRDDVLDVADRHVTEPGARYIDFLVPGLLGMNLMGGGLWGVGFVITDMRVKKLLRRLIATPMRRSHFLLSLVGGRMVFTIPEVFMLLGAGWLLFGMHIAGSLISIIIVALVGALSFAGIGLLVACRAQRLETISGLANLVMLPMWLFSGIFFSYERFPDTFQPFIQFLPLTHLIDALRAVVLEGAAITDQGIHMLVLLLWGLLSFAIALRWFRWT